MIKILISIGTLVTALLFLLVSKTAGFISLGVTCVTMVLFLVVTGGVSYQSHDAKHIDSAPEIAAHVTKYLFGIGRYAKYK